MTQFAYPPLTPDRLKAALEAHGYADVQIDWDSTARWHGLHGSYAVASFPVYLQPNGEMQAIQARIWIDGFCVLASSIETMTRYGLAGIVHSVHTMLGRAPMAEPVTVLETATTAEPQADVPEEPPAENVPEESPKEEATA